MLRYQLAALLLFIFGLTSLNAQQSFATEIKELARQLNVWRLTQGLEPLVYNPTLERMAAVQADYLVSLPDLPGDLHAGVQGENPRARSQFPEFAWPTYGHPQIMSVTEIAAIGSIRSALEFWRGSDIHNRSVTNPTYREVGIAARQYGSDILFIVVLGGRPGVLPALVDIESQIMYLTTERAEWQGEWIGEAIEYRFLDSEEQTLTDWVEWQRDIELKGDIVDLIEQATYIQYRDAADVRTHYELNFSPVWSSLPEPDVVQRPTLVPSATPLPPGVTPATSTPTHTPGGLFATNTIVPTATLTPTIAPTRTPFPTFTPTMTPAPGTVMFIYNDNVFTLYNAGVDDVDLTGISFRRDDVGFIGSFWEEVTDILNLSALPAGQCLAIEPESGITYVYPPECTMIRSIVQEPNPRYFWLGDFEVLIDDEVIATCDGEADNCMITLNQ